MAPPIKATPRTLSQFVLPQAIAGQERWTRGPVELPGEHDPDGSEELLRFLDGRPERYQEFAVDCYENDALLDDIRWIYEHRPLSGALVARLNPNVDLGSLAGDIGETGYPKGGLNSVSVGPV